MVIFIVEACERLNKRLYNTFMDPYDVLGLNYPSSKQEIKARYHSLAKQHHPDKLSHLNESERKVHEERFKKINIAYHLLMENDFQESSKQDWKGLWGYMNQWMSDPEWLKSMGGMLKEVMDIAKEYKKQKGSEHFIQVPVTLEEVYLKKEKKLRLFLHQIADPVFIQINCGRYPSYLYSHVTPEGKTLWIQLELVLQDHLTYTLDDLFGKPDLITSVELSLYEYVNGCSKSFIFLDGTSFEIEIPKGSLDPVILPGKGMTEKGSLRILPKVTLPTLSKLQQLDLKDLEVFTQLCKKLEDSKHPDVKSI